MLCRRPYKVSSPTAPFGVHLGFDAELPRPGVDDPVRGHHLDFVLHASRLKMDERVEVLTW
jgi:hypothetical protein